MATQSQIVVELQQDGVKICWQDGSDSFFHNVWLRNCCYCDQCGSTYTGTRFLQPSEIPLDIAVQDFEIVDDQIRITWEPDGHCSLYNMSWLKDCAYSETDRQKKSYRPVLWDSGISSDPPAVSYDEVLSNQNSYLDMLRKLRDYGMVVVRSGSKQGAGIERVANLIGEVADAAYGKIFDLSPKQKDLTLGTTMHPVPPHTDEAYLHSPTGILILYCIRPAERGGETVLVDGFNLAAQLKKCNPAAFDLLTRHPQPFHRVVHEEGIDQRTKAKVLVTDDGGEVVGFRFHTRTTAPLDVAMNLVKPLHAANFALSELMLDPKNQGCFQLEAGDAVLFDNHRIMHSRRGFSDPNRHLQVCNVSRDRFHQTLRFTAHKLGFADEANQTLPAGAVG